MPPGGWIAAELDDDAELSAFNAMLAELSRCNASGPLASARTDP
ncbi:hypothetical protein [Mycobacterium uberis]|nr:hypothetical protein [Mycobacterium uberis]